MSENMVESRQARGAFSQSGIKQIPTQHSCISFIFMLDILKGQLRTKFHVKFLHPEPVTQANTQQYAPSHTEDPPTPNPHCAQDNFCVLRQYAVNHQVHCTAVISGENYNKLQYKFRRFITRLNRTVTCCYYYYYYYQWYYYYYY